MKRARKLLVGLTPLNDIVKMSVQIPTIHDKEDEWAYGVMMNTALLELRHQGGGPVHINLTTTGSMNLNVKKLPNVQAIFRICKNAESDLPELLDKKIAIFVGAHKKWTSELTQIVEKFCEAYNGVVFCDHTSNYHGKYKILASLITNQKLYNSPCGLIDICIHIGDISGAYLNIKPKQVWRVNPDGKIRDTFKMLRYTFEMEEIDFFKGYVKKGIGKEKNLTYYEECKKEYERLLNLIPELPFSNIWIAQKTISNLPKESVLHFGILNSLRSWNFFEMSSEILGYSNTGGFGIDGGVSTLIGAALADNKKLFFGVVGDLAFFYDMNVLGNRHVGNNIRLIVVNNGRGTEFRNYGHSATKFGDDADTYIAAAGHYGNKSQSLIKHYAEDLGFEYSCANNKEEYLKNVERFVTPEITEKPMLFEVFTDSVDESNALKIMCELEFSAKGILKNEVKKVLGEKKIQTIKKFIK